MSRSSGSMILSDGREAAQEKHRALVEDGGLYGQSCALLSRERLCCCYSTIVSDEFKNCCNTTFYREATERAGGRCRQPAGLGWRGRRMSRHSVSSVAWMMGS